MCIHNLKILLPLILSSTALRVDGQMETMDPTCIVAGTIYQYNVQPALMSTKPINPPPLP
jgi:hypothetical protein